MVMVDAPQHLPGCCCVCRCTPKGPFVDLEIDMDDDRLYLCPSCVDEIKRITPLEAVVFTDKGDDAANGDDHTCPECGKVCKNQFGLTGHMRTHEKATA